MSREQSGGLFSWKRCPADTLLLFNSRLTFPPRRTLPSDPNVASDVQSGRAVYLFPQTQRVFTRRFTAAMSSLLAPP